MLVLRISYVWPAVSSYVKKSGNKRSFLNAKGKNKGEMGEESVCLLHFELFSYTILLNERTCSRGQVLS
ncbi:hypothetical protein DT065_00715 [Salicibibacter kimchii]|uniref:Uncharacterized protein n=1 Tax=Salicibibacter kimchii TaxID=2099786 RepID=A0A345BUQ3_9BACI|nr:hypothetical protein DT065_00715 [Salicibibacter kimchii]